MIRARTRWPDLPGLVIGVALALAVLIVAPPATARAGVSGVNPCPDSASSSYPWIGDVTTEAISFPSLADVTGATSYEGTVIRPTNMADGRAPVVVLQHGWGGDQCNLWWVALYLAGRGYVTEVHSSKFSPNPVEAYQSAIDATRSALANLDRLGAEGGPLEGELDLGRLGLGGHSLGSIVASSLQGDPELGIDAILTTDTLRRYAFGDPGGAVNECLTPPVESSQVLPRVPALSFAKDEPCDLRPDYSPPDLKLTGPRWWTAHGIPNMQLVMRGYRHSDFGDSSDEAKKRDMAVWIGAWFDRWLGGDRRADDLLLAPEVDGREVADLLSTSYLSSACLPGRADSENLGAWIGGPVGRVVVGRCDGFDPPKPRLSGLRLETVRKKVRPGAKLVFTLHLRNSGYAPFRKLKVRLSSGSHGNGFHRLLKVKVPARRKVSRRIEIRAGGRGPRKFVLVAKALDRSSRAVVRIGRRGR